MFKLYSVLCVLLLSLSAAQSDLIGNVSSSIIAEVLRQSPADNVIFSPILLSEGLVQLIPASGGTTLWEIRKMIPAQILTWLAHHYQKGVSLENRLYVGKDLNILPTYQQEVQKLLNATFETVDFKDSAKTVAKMNSWIAERTENKITKMIEKTDSDTMIMLLGAMNFKGNWQNPFNNQETLKSPFIMPEKKGGTQTVQIDTMVQTGGFRFDFLKELDADSIELPFSDSKVVLIILLPRKVDGMDTMLQHLNKLEVDDFEPQSTPKMLKLYLPKFKFEFETKLKSVLKQLGVIDIFEDADLQKLTDWKKGKLFVNEILQKTVIELNEDGANAAHTKAVTAEGSKVSSTPLTTIKVDHPFVFLIKDNDSIYLAGRVSSLK